MKLDPLNSMPQQDQDPSKILDGWHFKTFIVTLVLSIIGYFFFILWGGWQDVFSAAKMVGVTGISIALSLSLVNYGLRFLRWQLYLKALGHTVPWWHSLRIYISGFSLTTTPGKSGEAIRSIFLKEYDVPYRKSLGAFFSERTSDLISVILLSIFSLWDYHQAKIVIVIISLFLIFLIFAIQKESWLHAVERWANKVFPERFADHIEFVIEMVIAFRKCFALPVLLLSTFLGVAAWTAEGIGLYVILSYLQTGVDVSDSIFAYAFSLVIGAITLLPGGLGGAEVTMTQVLKLYGVSIHNTVAATILIRLSTLWFSVFLGLCALVYNLMRRKNNNK